METPAIDSSATLYASPDEHCNHWHIRHLYQTDARWLHDLIVRCPPLDVNSLYAYALLATHHSATCFVAIQDQRICAAVTGYIPPRQPDTYFLWQVAVAPEQQGTGLGSKLLDHIYQHCMLPNHLSHLETTISPGNSASQRLFSRFAKCHQVAITHTPLFSSLDLQPVRQADGLQGQTEQHEAEHLYRLGAWSV